jgi:hypothetical protein
MPTYSKTLMLTHMHTIPYGIQLAVCMYSMPSSLEPFFFLLTLIATVGVLILCTLPKPDADEFAEFPPGMVAIYMRAIAFMKKARGNIEEKVGVSRYEKSSMPLTHTDELQDDDDDDDADDDDDGIQMSRIADSASASIPSSGQTTSAPPVNAPPPDANAAVAGPSATSQTSTCATPAAAPPALPAQGNLIDFDFDFGDESNSGNADISAAATTGHQVGHSPSGMLLAGVFETAMPGGCTGSSWGSLFVFYVHMQRHTYIHTYIQMQTISRPLFSVHMHTYMHICIHADGCTGSSWRSLFVFYVQMQRHTYIHT